MYIAAKPTTRAILQQAAADLGVSFTGVPTPPAGDAMKLRPVRVGLWDKYGGSSPSGWMRWILERYEFPFDVTYVQALDAGRLAMRYDVIVLTDDAVTSSFDSSPSLDRVPPEYRTTTGALSRGRTVPTLKQFVDEGGTLIAVGRSTELAIALGLPISSALETGSEKRPLSREEFYIPGSILRARVDNATPLGFGFESDVDVFFDRSPVFRLDANAAATSVRRVAWFASASPLRSGWAWGQRYLENGVAVVDAPLGRGRVLLFGPEITYRAQPHGTFKFLFNGIYYGKAVSTRLP
jgi:hypothetical protein